MKRTFFRFYQESNCETMSDNPYSTPTAPSVTTSENMTGGFQKATQGKRFMGYIVDQIVLFILSSMAGFVVGIVVAASAGGVITEGTQATAQVFGFFVGMLVTLAYYVVMEMTTGKTVGKMVMKTRVVNESGGKASLGQIFGRSLCRFIPFEFISFFFGDSKRPTGWHDSIPKTQVVED